MECKIKKKKKWKFRKYFHNEAISYAKNASSLKIETTLPKIVHEIHDILDIFNKYTAFFIASIMNGVGTGCQVGQAYSRKGKTIGC